MVVRKLAVAATSFALLASMSVPAFAKDHENGGKHIKWDHYFNQSSDNQTYNNNFEDVNENSYGWASQAILKLAGEGVIAGIKENNHTYFNPGGQLSRAEFAALITRFFNLQPSSSQQDFNDVPTNAWYFNNVEAAKDYMTKFTNISGGYDFHPTAIMNRAETAVTLVEILMKQNAAQLATDDQANQILSTYGDAGLIPTSLRDYVATAIQYGLMRGVSDNSFDPLGKLNRAQAAELLYNIQNQAEVPPTGTTTTGGSSTEVPPGTTTTVGNTALSGQLSAPSTVVAGSTYNYTFTVYQNGTIDTALNGTYNVSVTSSNSGGVAVASTVTFNNGVATIPVTLSSTGSQTVTVSIAQLNVSAATTVTTQSASSTSLSAQLTAPSSTVTANAINNYTFTVFQNGSVDTALNGTYNVTVSTNGSGGASTSSQVTFTNGVATVPMALNSTGSQTVTVSFGQLNVSAATTVTVQ